MYEDDIIRVKVLLASALTTYLVWRCYSACRKQRRPTPLYRLLQEDDDTPVEHVVVVAQESARRRPARPHRQGTPPPSSPSPEWDLDHGRPARAPGVSAGPAVHGTARAPVRASDVAPPPYSLAASYAPGINEPPPTYQYVVDLQRRQSANGTPDT